MRSDLAFMMGEANRHKPLKVFDWDKAAQLIRERRPKRAEAGLSSDWEHTGGVIYEDGLPVRDDYTYLASTWATPELYMDGELIDCWRYQDETPGWDDDTKWPDSAIAILQDDVGSYEIV